MLAKYKSITFRRVVADEDDIDDVGNVTPFTTVLGGSCFADCNKLTSLALSTDIVILEAGCLPYSLVSLTLSARLKKISTDVFDHCDSLTQIVTIPPNTPFVARVDCQTQKVFNRCGCKCLNVMFTLEDRMEFGNNISGEVQTIARGTFDWCTLKSISLPGNVTALETRAFKRCYKLETISLPEHIVMIGSECFADCPNLKTVEFGNNISCMGRNLFLNCSKLEKIVFDEITTTIPLTIFVLNEKAQEKGWRVKVEKADVSIMKEKCVEQSVQINEVCSSAFENSDITCINLENCEKVEKTAFKGSKLAKIEFSNRLKEIDEFAFSYCDKLTSIVLPSSVLHLGSNCFLSCGLSQITVLVKEIPVNCFSFCEQLSKVECANVQAVRDCAFSYCKSLKDISLTASSIIGEGVFIGCSELTNVRLSDSVLVIPNNMFCQCSKLQNVILPASVSRIGDFVFSQCSELNSIIFPTKLEYIGKSCFNKCESMTEVVLNAVKELGVNCFSFCSNLVTLDLEKCELTEIPEGFCKLCTKLETVVSPNGLTAIKKNAFSGCVSLSKFALPQNVSCEGSSFKNANKKFDGSSSIDKAAFS
ncbi:hypothetical protein EIN_186290 [Entamoeba invadens IP1]|uniref:hypothetical protein n=1 Tax=Entamoeba invadens IP1 TaxID=370355 RepID=UPI0002C3E926|nr:hypothetical protein EIN_186290 [Entamoeba invadens IP1]ELP94202.1 hypothetical protein EIN_186290 [Entamoeba invadens IP1]|eukprot:XP_004260973.1 hypothetical protein EIN_186290 [Entamoeba invadens IP1]